MIYYHIQYDLADTAHKTGRFSVCETVFTFLCMVQIAAIYTDVCEHKNISWKVQVINVFMCVYQ